MNHHFKFAKLILENSLTRKHSEPFHRLTAQIPAGPHVDGGGQERLFITCEAKVSNVSSIQFKCKRTAQVWAFQRACQSSREWQLLDKTKFKIKIVQKHIEDEELDE